MKQGSRKSLEKSGNNLEIILFFLSAQKKVCSKEWSLSAVVLLVIGLLA